MDHWYWTEQRELLDSYISKVREIVFRELRRTSSRTTPPSLIPEDPKANIFNYILVVSGPFGNINRALAQVYHLNRSERVWKKLFYLFGHCAGLSKVHYILPHTLQAVWLLCKVFLSPSETCMIWKVHMLLFSLQFHHHSTTFQQLSSLGFAASRGMSKLKRRSLAFSISVMVSISGSKQWNMYFRSFTRKQ